MEDVRDQRTVEPMAVQAGGPNQPRVNRLRQQIEDQEAVVAALLAAKQQRRELMESLLRVKELTNRQESASTTTTTTTTTTTSATTSVGGTQADSDALALQSDVQDLIAAVEASVRIHEATANANRSSSSRQQHKGASGDASHEAVIEELLREEAEERRQATRQKKQSKQNSAKARATTATKKKKITVELPAKADAAKAVANDPRAVVEIIESAPPSSSNHSTDANPSGSSTQAVDVAAVLAALEIFSESAASPQRPLSDQQPSWLEDTDEGSSLVAPNSNATGKPSADSAEEVDYEEDFESNIDDDDDSGGGGAAMHNDS